MSAILRKPIAMCAWVLILVIICEYTVLSSVDIHVWISAISEIALCDWVLTLVDNNMWMVVVSGIRMWMNAISEDSR